MNRYKFYFHKIEYEDVVVEADSIEEAFPEAKKYLNSLKTDFYNGGDWYMDEDVTQL